MIVFKKHIGECWVIFWVMFFFWLLGFLVAVVQVGFVFWLLFFFPVVSCLFDCFHRKIEMIFVVVYNLENRNPPETENKSARKPGVRWCRQGTNQNNSKLCFHRKKPSSELCLKISYRWLLDFCWFFVCTKVSQLLLLFEVVIRSKREYKVVHCVNLTIFFLLVVA